MNTIEIQQMMNEQQTEQKMNELEQMLLLIFSLLFLNLTSRLVPRAVPQWRTLIPVINDEFRKIKKEIPSGLSIIAKELHESTLLMIQEQGIEITSRLTNKDIEQIIQKRIANLTLNDRIERNRKRFIVQLRDVLIQSKKRNETIEELSERIRNLVTNQANRMRLILRTEVHRVRNTIIYDLAQKASQREPRLKKTWVAVMDSRTRPAHRRLHGTTIPIKGLFKSTAGGIGPGPGLMGNPGDDINCRCRLRINLS
ncbi:MAG TPA: phage minor head protein [Pseudothermotoga sp.]